VSATAYAVTRSTAGSAPRFAGGYFFCPGDDTPGSLHAGARRGAYGEDMENRKPARDLVPGDVYRDTLGRVLTVVWSGADAGMARIHAADESRALVRSKIPGATLVEVVGLLRRD